MNDVLVLGIGNRLMMDDGIGIYLTDELKIRNNLAHVTFLVGETDIDYCLEHIEGRKFIIILDAVYTDKPPGDVSLFSLADFSKQVPLQLSPHNLHLFHMLSQVKTLNEGVVIGIQPYEIHFQLGLSPVLQEKWPIILEKVETIMNDLLNSWTGSPIHSLSPLYLSLRRNSQQP